jgi:peptidase E
MTKYILHGGFNGQQTSDNKLFYQEMVKGFDKPNVLLVYFSREESEYDYLSKRDAKNFAWAEPDKTCNLIVATKENFVAQLAQSDVVFMCGGVTTKLLETMKHLNVNLKDLFADKVIAGSSAGANLISEWHYGNVQKAVMKGLGLLPITVFVHYKAAPGTEFWKPDKEIEAIEKELIRTSGRKEIIKIPEQKFVTIET